MAGFSLVPWRDFFEIFFLGCFWWLSWHGKGHTYLPPSLCIVLLLFKLRDKPCVNCEKLFQKEIIPSKARDFLVKDIETCSQLVLWILRDDDTLSVLPAGVRNFASPQSPPPCDSAAVFSNFHHPKILFPSSINISDSRHRTLFILEMFWKTWSLQMRSHLRACSSAVLFPAPGQSQGQLVLAKGWGASGAGAELALPRVQPWPEPRAGHRSRPWPEVTRLCPSSP